MGRCENTFFSIHTKWMIVHRNVERMERIERILLRINDGKFMTVPRNRTKLFTIFGIIYAIFILALLYAWLGRCCDRIEMVLAKCVGLTGLIIEFWRYNQMVVKMNECMKHSMCACEIEHKYRAHNDRHVLFTLEHILCNAKGWNGHCFFFFEHRHSTVQSAWKTKHANDGLNRVLTTPRANIVQRTTHDSHMLRHMHKMRRSEKKTTRNWTLQQHKLKCVRWTSKSISVLIRKQTRKK